jgi:hypothetical protein
MEQKPQFPTLPCNTFLDSIECVDEKISYRLPTSSVMVDARFHDHSVPFDAKWDIRPALLPPHDAKSSQFDGVSMPGRIGVCSSPPPSPPPKGSDTDVPGWTGNSRSTNFLPDMAQ